MTSRVLQQIGLVTKGLLCREVLGATQHFCLVVINSHVVVEGTFRRHLLLTYVAVVLEHARKMDRFTVVPHSNSADEPLATDGAYPLILA